LAFLAISETVAAWKPFLAKICWAARKIAAPLRGFFKTLELDFILEGLAGIRKALNGCVKK
jgi:hypothetical protein